jgi:hypothetical protein
MRYKAGDEVRIRADLKEGDGEQYKATVVSEMMRYAGKVTYIRHAYDGCYTLDIDNGYWTWMDSMFEDVDIPQIVETKTIDVGYKLDCGRRGILKDVIQGDTSAKRLYYTKNYEFQYILPIECIEWIIPHED